MTYVILYSPDQMDNLPTYNEKDFIEFAWRLYSNSNDPVAENFDIDMATGTAEAFGYLFQVSKGRY